MTTAPTLTRMDWQIDPAVAYLNHGGFGALPRPVADAAGRIRAEVEANPTDVFMRRWPGLVGDVRERVAAFLNASPEELVFVGNATTGTATVLAGFGLQPGDHVVATDHRYPAVAEQLTVLGAHGVEATQVSLPLDIDQAGVVAAVTDAITERTRLVVIDHIASATGMVFPVADIVAAVHARGLPVLVDGAHAPGQVPVDLAAIGADFWVGNLHKWVCSPRGCAALRVAPRWHDRIRPLVASHDHRRGFQPAFDWTGTFDPIPLLAIPAALDFWDELGWDVVRRHQHQLVTDGATVVADHLSTRVPIRDDMTAAMRLVALPAPIDKLAGETLGHRLTVEHGVTAYVTHHEGESFVRICGQLYNVPEHYERLATALPVVLRGLSERGGA